MTAADVAGSVGTRVFDDGIRVDTTLTVEVPGGCVEGAPGHTDVERRFTESEHVDGFARLEPLDEPAGLVRIVVAGEGVVDARDRVGGEAVAGGRSICPASRIGDPVKWRNN